MAKRVVVTGMGIYSCIGKNLDEVIKSLREGKAGIGIDPKRTEYGLSFGRRRNWQSRYELRHSKLQKTLHTLG